MRQRLEFWQNRAGIKRFPFSGFRHTFAVYSLRNHADLLDIKEQLGHASVKTTAIYLEVVDEGRKQTAPPADQPTQKPEKSRASDFLSTIHVAICRSPSPPLQRGSSIALVPGLVIRPVA